MGARKKRITPAWVKTAGAMLDEGVVLRAHCRTCRNMFSVDLAAIAAQKGRDFSLLGVTPACKIVTCRGLCVFLYSPGKGTPFRPLPDA